MTTHGISPVFAYEKTEAILSEDGRLTVSTLKISGADGTDTNRTECYLNLDRTGTGRLSQLLRVPPEQLKNRLSPVLERDNSFDLFRRFCDRYGVTYEYGDFSD